MHRGYPADLCLCRLAWSRSTALASANLWRAFMSSPQRLRRFRLSRPV